MRSIILDPGVKDLLLEDARDFLDSKDWYNSRGIAHRRGYLLHGKPGSGKTSLIQAIAGELGLNVYIISLSRAGLDDTTLASAIGELPSRCIALMEDLDAAFHRGITREQEDSADDGDDAAGGPKAGPKGPPASRITLSGLLNALDGVGAQEGRILFATTNRYNVLDSALIRPGRLDLHIEFKHASTFQIEELFRTFYQPDIRKEKEKDAAKPASDTEEVSAVAVDEDVPLIDLDAEKPVVAPLTPASTRSGSPASEGTPGDSSAHAKAGITVGISHSTRAPAFTEAQYDQLAEQFGAQIPSDTFSMAALQGYLMSWKIDPRGAVKNVRVWVDKELRERKKKEPKVAEVEETVS
jgi:chaperone BCS1